MISSYKYHADERDNILRDQIVMNITSNIAIKSGTEARRNGRYLLQQ